MNTRQIKFRAWHKELEDMTLSYKNEVIFWDNVSSYPEMYEIMQYTGLKDKNNKEIFEGDILCAIRKLDCFHPDLAMLPEYQPKKEYRVAEFKIDNDGISFLLPREARYNERGNPVQWEIVGNIYETPQLIESQP